MFHDYIIVGAGPAGLQMGYLLEQAGRDYLLLDAADRAGSFFTKFPRHRRLNSFNKRFNWFKEPEFGLRFDWHSLLTHDYSFNFEGYSKDIFPNADALAQYLSDFCDHFGIKVAFDTRVTLVDRDPATRHFILSTADGTEYRCRTLVLATGPQKIKIPDIEGIEHAVTYDVHDSNPDAYADKRVLIVGGGISGFETANNLAGAAAAITIATGPNHIRHAWRTHFAGDLRASDNTILDMAALKMMHGFYSMDVTRITKEPDGTLHAYFREELPHWTEPGVAEGWMPVDHVIMCTGWTFIDQDLFAPSIRPEVIRGGQYALMSATWETTVPDLYVIGTAMGGRTLRSPNATLHGFRYSVRAAYHHLMERYEGVKPPHKVFPLRTEADLRALGREMVERMSLSSGLFQAAHILADAVLFDLDAQEATVYYEMPVDYFLEHPDFAAKPVIYFTLELGYNNFPTTDPNSFDRRNDPNRPGCVAVLHPVMRLYENGRFVRGRNNRGSIGTRYDANYKGFEHDMDDEKPRNVVLNFLNEVAGVTATRFAEEHFHNSEDRGGFRRVRDGERLSNPGLPDCALEVGGLQVADFGHLLQVQRRPDGTIPPWVHSKLFEASGVQ